MIGAASMVEVLISAEGSWRTFGKIAIFHTCDWAAVLAGKSYWYFECSTPELRDASGFVGGGTRFWLTASGVGRQIPFEDLLFLCLWALVVPQKHNYQELNTDNQAHLNH